MNECKGDWLSTIQWERKDGTNIPVSAREFEDDGDIQVDAHSAQSITGSHRGANGDSHTLQSGTCAQASADKFQISFDRDESGETFHYSGDGKLLNPTTGKAVIHGRVIVRGGPPGSGDTGTWEATRPGGSGFGGHGGGQQGGGQQGGGQPGGGQQGGGQPGGSIQGPGGQGDDQDDKVDKGETGVWDATKPGGGS